jgi:hypothetical protein
MRNSGKVVVSRRGVAIVEFTLSLVFLIPLLLGTFVFGFRLIRSTEMEQIVRDVGHMYVRNIDFTQPGPVSNAQTMAQGFSLTSTGTSLLILSTIRIIQQSDCDAANPTKPAGTPCTNLNNPVFTQQIMIGNTSLTANGVAIHASVFGTPPVQSNDSVLATDQANTLTAAAGNTAAVTGFPKVLLLNAGEYAYVVEMFNATSELNISGLTGAPQVYARSIF